jgi:outer membrane beta-barrel protein
MTTLKSLLPAALLAVGLLCAPAASAQAADPADDAATDAAAPEEAAPEEAAPEEAAPEEAPPAAAPPAAAEPVEPAAPEPAARTWAERRQVRVIEKRVFRKDTRHEFTVFGGLVPNDEFFTYVPVGLRYNYFFAEDFSFELWGNYLVNTSTGLQSFLEEKTSFSILVEIPQTLLFLAGVDATWSPIHGKLSLPGGGLSHFDFHIAFGAGVIGTEVVDTLSRATNFQLDVSGNLGLGVRWFLNDFLSLRLDYRQYFYPADSSAGGGLAYPVELTLGVSLWTAAPE